MSFNKIFLSTAFVFAIGCSNAQKKSDATANAAPEKKSAASSTATTAKSDSNAEMNCQKKSESRKLRIESLQPKGCNLWYSTHGDKDPVATSKVSNGHCEQVRNKIQKKLEAAGFKCS
jgi:hypothetical protein